MINIGQVGIGVWGGNLLRNFFGIKGCRVKACCDGNEAVLEKVRRQYNDMVEVGLDYEVLLKDKDIDGIVIATLPATHAQLAIKAFKAGKHVFVEKPMALDIVSAREMIKTAKRFKKILMVGHLLLYHPAVRKIKEYVLKGSLGDIHYMYSTRVNLGQVREIENALWSLTAHDISVGIYLLGSRPKEVAVMGRSYLRKGIEDMVFLSLGFRRNTMMHIHASWLDPHKIRKFTVVGSKKMVVFDDMQAAEKVRIYDKGINWQRNYGNYETFLTLRQGDIHIPRVDMVEPLKLECEHFIDCIANNKHPFTDGENGLAVLKVLMAGQRSLELKGQPVKINP